MSLLVAVFANFVDPGGQRSCRKHFPHFSEPKTLHRVAGLRLTEKPSRDVFVGT